MFYFDINITTIKQDAVNGVALVVELKYGTDGFNSYCSVHNVKINGDGNTEEDDLCSDDETDYNLVVEAIDAIEGQKKPGKHPSLSIYCHHRLEKLVLFDDELLTILAAFKNDMLK